MKSEQELANELDALLTARLKGQPAKASGDMQTEVQLANALFDLAAKAEPDPVFLSSLEARLARAASRQQKQKKAPERPSFWQQLLNTVEETFAMNRTVFALGTMVALIIVGFFAIRVLFPNDGIEPGVIANVNTPTSENEVTAAGEAETAVTQTLPQGTPDFSNLPSLPSLSSGSFGGGGFGGGGGGGEITSSEAFTNSNGDMAFRPYNPFSGTVYALNAPLPTDPQIATVYQQPGLDTITLDDMRYFAERFHVGGEIYTQAYPVYESAPGEEPFTPPNFYFMFDGLRTLSGWGNSLQYYDQSAVQDFTTELMNYEQARPIAEAFLRDRGLLDFDYQIVAPLFNGNEVNFYRVVNGRLVNTPEYTVSINSEGQVLSVYYNPMTKLQALGDYPLISAESAWQQLISEGVDNQHSYYITSPGPDFVYAEPDVLVEDLYKYWQRIYSEGETINVYTGPTAYFPVESNAAPYIQADQFILTGSDDVLRAIADQVGQQIRVDGTVHYVDGLLTLAINDWEVADFIDYQYQQGTIRHSDGQTLFDAANGQTYLVPDAPTDVAEGERVNLNGWSIEPGQPYPVFNWQGMDRIVEFTPPAEEVILEPVEPYRIGQIEITSVDLIYAYMTTVGETRFELQAYLQPAWRFKGTTDTNEIIEFVVQAVPDDYVTVNDNQ